MAEEGVAAMLREVRKKRAHEDIVRQIRSLVEKGKLKKGQKLPPERELSEIFKVSRATVREAIFSLEAMDLVSRRQGDGTYITAARGEDLVQPLALSLVSEKDDLIDILSLRKLIEPEVAQLASGNARPGDIRNLEKILRRQEMEVNLGRSPVRTDAEFHHALAQVARNRIFERLLREIMDLLEKTRGQYLQTEERKHTSLQGHREILAAIQTGNGAKARLAMRRHLHRVESILFKRGGEREI
jgi:GntR family transcriptional regulator, transcriptional repressor for pyruvate dehydrogenase complex